MKKDSVCKYVTFLYLNRKLEHKLQDAEFLLFIEQIINELPKEQKRIICNDFLVREDKKNKNWYLEYYSTATYYRIRKQAIDNFVNLLNKEKML